LPATEIIPNLFVGDAIDATQWEGRIICVLEQRPLNEPLQAICIPVLRIIYNGQLNTVPDGALHVDSFILNTVLEIIDYYLNKGERVLVHCAMGSERSPLVVAKYLEKYKGMSLDDAYALLKAKRPQVADRRIWLS
jgi:predicted protein tyrosine phosphatase